MPPPGIFPTGLLFSAEELFQLLVFFMSNQRVLLCAAELDDIGPASVGRDRVDAGQIDDIGLMAAEKHENPMSVRSKTALSQALEKTLCEYGEDLDNNGKVSVQVLNVSYSDTDTNKNFKNSQAQALRGELLSERCFLVITDDTRFEQIKSEGYFEKLKELSDKDGYAYTANDKTPLGKKIISEFKNMGYEYYGDVENGLNLSLRYSGDDKNTDAATRREQQKQLLLKIAEDK